MSDWIEHEPGTVVLKYPMVSKGWDKRVLKRVAMKKEWLGITLAVSIGLNVSAGAALPMTGQVNIPENIRVTAPSADPLALLVMAATGKSSKMANSAPMALRQGIAQYNRGYIAKAIPLFVQATRQAPQNPEAFLWLARAYQKQGTPTDQANAKAAYQKVLALAPNQLEALSQLGEMWSWEPAHREESIDLLLRAHTLNPSDASISKKLAQALFWKGDSMDALRYAAPIADRFKGDRQWMADYAQMLSATGHADEALRIYNTVLKGDAGSTAQIAPLRLQQASALLKSGRKDEALALYEELSEAASHPPLSKKADFLQAMASLAFDLGVDSDVLRWDDGLPASIQRQKEIQLRDARALRRAFRTPEAMERFQRLYEAGLLSVDEKLEYADWLMDLHLPAESLPAPDLMASLYEQAYEEAPDNPEVQLRMARYAAQDDTRFDEAVKAYQKALSNPSLSQADTVRKEFLDYIKSDKTHAASVEALFRQMLTVSPDDADTQAAYAEFLSWRPDRRTEALRMYVALAKGNPENREVWEGRIEEVLKWHQPSTVLIPVYQDIVNVFPTSKAIWLAVARAYRSDKSYYREAVDTYSVMVRRYPQDATIKREWLGLLSSAKVAQRGDNIRLLKKMTQDDPSDLDVLATYGKLLSYEHRYGEAMDAFEQVLAKNPDHRDALLGKGYVILWSGKKLAAKDFFQDLRNRYPDDVDVAIGLAQTEKLLGRYDEAIRIIQQIKPLMDQQQQEQQSEDKGLPSGNALQTPVEGSIRLGYVADNDVPDPLEVPVMSDVPMSMAPSSSATETSATPDEVKALQSELDALSDAVQSLKLIQQSSRKQLDRLDQTIRVSRDAMPDEIHIAPEADTMASTGEPSAKTGYSVGQAGMQPVYGSYSALDYDTNPLLSGVGRFRNDDLSDLEKGLINELRPMFRAGFLYSSQDGEATTTRISSWGFPNQLSFSLTPQVRLRGGIRPTRYFLPDGVSPSKTWGLEYAVGATFKYWDRLTLDADVAMTHFTQSKTENLTFQAQAQYDFNDAISAKVGVSRLPQYNSLLAVAGVQPSQGAYRDELVGQARENSVYVELNTHPFSPNWDWNLGYSWAFIDGSHVPRNFKNQAFTSFGYTHHFASNHQVRLGYEFLYFGYGKNATNGFFDTTASGLKDPVSSLDPVTLANSGYVYGGYFSPSLFFMNAARLDFRGSLFNKFIEYKLGGSLGAQTIRLGHGIHEDGGGTSLSSAFDANLIVNMTDWLAAYGDVDFLDAGGQFNRWRFGGGLIVRPHITGLSPLFGSKNVSPARTP